MDTYNRLVLFYKKNGLTMTQLADILGIDQTTISKYKNSDKIPEYAIIIMEMKLGLNREWLLTGKGEMVINSKGLVSEEGIPYEVTRVLSNQEIMSELVLTNKRLVCIIERHSITIENLSRGEISTKNGKVGT